MLSIELTFSNYFFNNCKIKRIIRSLFFGSLWATIKVITVSAAGLIFVLSKIPARFKNQTKAYAPLLLLPSKKG